VSTRQLLLLMFVTTGLALTLALVIEQAQVKRFRVELADWWENLGPQPKEANGGSTGDDGTV
jgi:hypothetical protein